MSIVFNGLSFEKVVNTRTVSTSKERKKSTSSVSPLRIVVSEHLDKKTGITTIKSQFKISPEMAEKMNIQGLVGDIWEGKSIIVMHPATDESKGKIFSFSEKSKEGKKSLVFKADVLLATLKKEGLVPTEFGAVKGESVNLNIVDITASIEGFPTDFVAWQIEKSEIVEGDTKEDEDTTGNDTPLAEQQVSTETTATAVTETAVQEEIEDSDLY